MKVKKWLLGLVTFAAMVVLCAVCTGAETYRDYEFSVLSDGTVEITDYNGSAEKVDIPKTIAGKSVTSIGEYAFCNCTSFTSITIPDSVTSIGNDAFNGCTSLTSITIPSSVTSIRTRTFKGCANLTSITIPDSVTSIGWSAFGDCASLTSITIPDSVTSIGNEAFYNCTSITKVTIPDSVVSIGGLAFSDCTSLTSITIPDSVTIINDFMFSGCKSLNDVNIPDGVTYVGEGAFSRTAICNNQTEEVKYIDKWLVDSDSSVTDVAVKDGTVGISCGAFSYCGQLKNISIPNSVKYVGGKAFYNCISLTNVVLPYGITNIGVSTFSGCESLASVTIPDSVTSIGEHAFFNTALLKNQTTTEKYVGKWVIDWDSDVKNVTIKNGTVGIADHAFERRTSLESITIPDSVEYIGVYAFLDCWELTQVNMPESMTTIGDCAFYGCDSIESVIVPKGVTKIGDWFFYGCASLASVSIPDSVIDIQLNAFEKCVALNEINVDEMNKAYKSDSGVLLNKNETELILYPAGKKETTYNIPNSVVTINRSAFENVSALESIIIPNSVVNIERFAIYNCKLLTSVSIPLSVKNIGEYALGYYQGEHFETSKISNFKIECYAKTIGEQYAFDNGFEYTLIGHTHNFNKWVIIREPTCTENGINTRSCDGCLKFETKTINALGHDYSTTWTTDMAATCGASGSKSHHCTRCSDKKDVTAIPATGNHKFGAWSIIQSATCTTTGTQTRTCSVCGKTETATIAKVAHKYVDAVVKPTYTAQGYTLHKCSVCGTSSKDTYTAKLVLAKVTGAKLTGRAADALRVNWNKDVNASGYIVEMYQGNKWVRVAKITNNATTTYRASGLKASTVYKFRVRAYKMEGKAVAYGAYSTELAARTNPSVVKGAKLTGRAADALRINWTKNASADGYIVEMYQSGKWARVAKITSNSTTTFRKAGLKAWTVYKFRVRAYKMSGKTALYGNYSATVTARTNPSIVKGVKIGGKAKDALRVNWTKNTSAQGYIVEMYKGGKWIRVAKITNGNTTTFRKSGLAKNTTYKFRVCAYYMSGKTALYGNYGRVSGKTAAK